MAKALAGREGVIKRFAERIAKLEGISPEEVLASVEIGKLDKNTREDVKANTPSNNTPNNRSSDVDEFFARLRDRVINASSGEAPALKIRNFADVIETLNLPTKNKRDISRMNKGLLASIRREANAPVDRNSLKKTLG